MLYKIEKMLYNKETFKGKVSMNEIIKKIQLGDKEELNRLVLENLEEIKKIISSFKNIVDDFEDLVNVGVEAFINSVYAYNFSKTSFFLYSRIYIYTAVYKYVLKNIDRISDIEKRYAICLDAYDKCALNLGKEPTDQDMLKYYRIKLEYIKKILTVVNNPSDKSTTMREYFETINDDIFNNVDNQLLKRMILNSKLTKKQKKYILLYYGFNGQAYTQQEIGDMNNTSRSDIGQTISRGILRLKKNHLEELKKYYYE